MKNNKVIIAGHICLDITPVFMAQKVDSLRNYLVPGKLINMKEANVHTGGAVANTGLAMKILGMDVKLIGKAGNDAFGRIVQELLREYGADDGLILADNTSTSYTIVVAPPGIDRIFLHNSGANDTFTSEDITEEDLESAALLHFGYPPLMKSMYQDNGAELVKLFQKAKSMEVATSLDMAAVDAKSEAGRADWEKILSKVLPYVDFFVPSIEELCYMLDRTRFKEWTARADGMDITGILDIEKDIRPLAEKCAGLGVKVLLLKCGAPGMYYWTSSREALKKTGDNLKLDYSDWAGREGFERSYIPERVLSATGAGDISIAAFLTAMLMGYSFEECIHLSSAAGASCVEAYDALSGLKTLKELERKIQNGWDKTKK